MTHCCSVGKACFHIHAVWMIMALTSQVSVQEGLHTMRLEQYLVHDKSSINGS